MSFQKLWFPVKWLFLIFILPALLSLGWWSVVERPTSWRNADWTSAGILPDASSIEEPTIHIMSARTGGLKGALSVHTWIVVKRRGAQSYDRYEKVGWGRPVRHNAYAADARWYSNEPQILKTVSGNEADKMIPQIEAAIENYHYNNHGGYSIWPGPNSNSFVAHVLREVSSLDMVLPPNAVGRDFITNGKLYFVAPNGLDFRFSAGGFFGFAIGMTSGVEVNFLGLVSGLDLRNPAIKIPGFGRFGF